MKLTDKQMTTLAILGVAGFVIWRASKAVQAVGGAVVQGAQTAVKATVYAGGNLPTSGSTALAIQPATVMLGDGRQVPWTAITLPGMGDFDWWASNPVFYYQGDTYQFVSQKPDDTNTYYGYLLHKGIGMNATVTPGVTIDQIGINNDDSTPGLYNTGA